ncbi:MAG: hypothetical protein AAF235_09760 [Planctomycetota bacterium]
MTNIRTLSAILMAFTLTGCERAPPPDGAPLDTNRILSEGGNNPGQVLYPRAIDADDSGIWLVDKAGRVQRFDGDSGEVTHSFTLADIEQGKPTGITIAPLPTDPSRLGLWIAETHNFRVIVLDLEQITSDTQPAPVASFGSFGQEAGQFIYVTDVAVLTNTDNTIHRIYVSEYGSNDRITIFDADYNVIKAFGTFGVGMPDNASDIILNRPQSIEIDRQARELIITDSCNHRLGRFTLDGELIAWIGAPDDDTFRYPYGLLLLDNRQALVAEFGGNRLSLVDLDAGAVIRTLGVPGRERGQLASPWGLAAIGDEVFVLDSANNRIQVINSPAPPQPRYAAVEGSPSGS